MIAYFWYHKFRTLGFTQGTANVFAYSVECRSESLIRNHPEQLSSYLRSEAAKKPSQFATVPMSEWKRRKIKSGSREATDPAPPQLQLPKPSPQLFHNKFWVRKLLRAGISAPTAKRYARIIAKGCYLMPPDIRGLWLREHCSDDKISRL